MLNKPKKEDVDMSKITDTIKLMAKTGLYFAHVDGNYDEREKNFLENFVAGIEQIGALEEDVKADVKDALNHTYTLDELVKETKDLVSDFTEEEKTAILNTMRLFISKVIATDKNISDVEHDEYAKWREAMGLWKNHSSQTSHIGTEH